MVKELFPIVGDLITRVFAAGRKYLKECKAARIDIDKNVTIAISAWKGIPCILDTDTPLKVKKCIQ